MQAITKEQLTLMLNEASAGDADASDRVWNMLYDELRQQAAGLAIKESDDVQPSVIVSEVYLRLFTGKPTQWDNRRHYFGAVSRAMQQYLVDRARSRSRIKRGGDRARIPLTIAVGELADYDAATDGSIPELMRALDRLEADLPHIAEVVRNRYLCGMTVEACANVMGIAPRTVKKYWAFGRAWLRDTMVAAGYALGDDDGPERAGSRFDDEDESGA